MCFAPSSSARVHQCAIPICWSRPKAFLLGTRSSTLLCASCGNPPKEKCSYFARPSPLCSLVPRLYLLSSAHLRYHFSPLVVSCCSLTRSVLSISATELRNHSNWISTYQFCSFALVFLLSCSSRYCLLSIACDPKILTLVHRAIKFHEHICSSRLACIPCMLIGLTASYEYRSLHISSVPGSVICICYIPGPRSALLRLISWNSETIGGAIGLDIFARNSCWLTSSAYLNAIILQRHQLSNTTSQNDSHGGICSPVSRRTLRFYKTDQGREENHL